MQPPKISKTDTGANYFKLISDGADELTRLADEYLSKFEFLPSEEMCQRIWDRGCQLFRESGENWDAVPWWVAQVADGYVPYSGIPHNGSIGFALAFSSASQDAHLRNLMEIAEGRETQELDFPVAAPMPEIVDDTPVKRRRGRTPNPAQCQ